MDIYIAKLLLSRIRSTSGSLPYSIRKVSAPNNEQPKNRTIHHHQAPFATMATDTTPCPPSLLGTTFVLHLPAAPCSFTGSPPTGLGTGTLDLLLCVLGVLLAGFAAAKQG